MDSFQANICPYARLLCIFRNTIRLRKIIFGGAPDSPNGPMQRAQGHSFEGTISHIYLLILDTMICAWKKLELSRRPLRKNTEYTLFVITTIGLVVGADC